MFSQFAVFVLSCLAFVAQVQTPLKIETGYLSAYDERPTKATIQYRISNEQLPENWHDYTLIAVLDCSQIGQKGLMFTSGGIYPFLVFDCAGKADGGYDWMIKNQMAAEASWRFRRNNPDLIHSLVTLVFLE